MCTIFPFSSHSALPCVTTKKNPCLFCQSEDSDYFIFRHTGCLTQSKMHLKNIEMSRLRVHLYLVALVAAEFDFAYPICKDSNSFLQPSLDFDKDIPEHFKYPKS